MGLDKLDDYDYPPAPGFSLEEPAPVAFGDYNNNNNGAADFGRISFAPSSFRHDVFSFGSEPLPNAHPPLQKMDVDQSCMQASETDDKLMANFLNQNRSQNLHIDPCSDDAKTNVTKNLGASEVTNYEGDQAEICQSIKASDIFTMDSLKVGNFHSSSLGDPTLYVNIVSPGSNTVGGNQIVRQGTEAESKSLSRMHTTGIPLSLGHTTSVMHHTMDLGQKQNTCDNICYDQLGCSEQFDGNFLTLGIGSNQEASSKRQFCAKETARKLEEAVHPQSKRAYSQQSTRVPPSVTHNWAGSMSSLCSIANQPSSLGFNAGGWIFTNNNGGVIHSASTGLNSRPLYGVPRSEANTRPDSTVNSYGNSDYVCNTRVTCSDTFPARGIEGDQYPIPFPLGSNYAYVSHSESTNLPGLTSATANPAWITPQPMPNYLQDSHGKRVIDTLRGSSLCVHPTRLGESSLIQHQIGAPRPPSEGNATQAFDSHSNLINTPLLGKLASAHESDSLQAADSAMPGRIQGQVTGVGSLPPSSDASFSSRLGVQTNNAAAQAINEGKVHPTQSFARSQLSRNLAVALGQIEGGMPVQNSQGLPRADCTTGQIVHMPEVDGSQATGGFIRPSVKRRAIAPPSVTSMGQRRKITPQPISQNSISYLRQSVPAPSPMPVPPYATSPVPVNSALPVPPPPALAPPRAPAPTLAARSIQVSPAPHYIKWKGTEEPPQRLGYKCLICKRDLSYTPDGPFYQPAVPPPVAVLSCGHTFHDHCLQNITPQDQSKDPPCIPCAIGET